MCNTLDDSGGSRRGGGYGVTRVAPPPPPPIQNAKTERKKGENKRQEKM